MLSRWPTHCRRYPASRSSCKTNGLSQPCRPSTTNAATRRRSRWERSRAALQAPIRQPRQQQMMPISASSAIPGLYGTAKVEKRSVSRNCVHMNQKQLEPKFNSNERTERHTCVCVVFFLMFSGIHIQKAEVLSVNRFPKEYDHKNLAAKHPKLCTYFIQNSVYL